MFKAGDDADISAPIRSLETQHFIKVMKCSKQLCHQWPSNYVRYPPDVLRGRVVPGNSPDCVNHKRATAAWYISMISRNRSGYPCNFAYSSITLFLFQCNATAIRIHSWLILFTSVMSGRLPIKMAISQVLLACQTYHTFLRTSAITSSNATCVFPVMHKHKRDNLSSWLKCINDLACQVLLPLYVRLLRHHDLLTSQRLSGIIHGCSCVQRWHQGDCSSIIKSSFYLFLC